MARHTFFSFHYDLDIFRANQVRNSWVFKLNQAEAGFFDDAGWEKARKSKTEIKRWINNRLDGASVTVVLIGQDTVDREWVNYELQRSFELGMGLMGIYIHNCKDIEGLKTDKGSIDFEPLGKDKNGKDILFKNFCNVYDWIDDDGYNNLGIWIEDAYQQAHSNKTRPVVHISEKHAEQWKA